MSDPILLGEYDGIPYFEKIIRSMRVYESLDNPEVQEEYLLLLINLVKLWHISDPRYGKSFLELFPLHVLKKILNDARYSKKIQFPPELAQYNARSESHHSLKEIALELLYLAFSDPSNYERLHEWHLIDVLTENLSCTTRSSALMYLEHVANSDVYMYELLNPRLVRRLAQLSLGSPVIELDTRRTYLYLLLKMLDIVTLCDNTPTDSEGVHITPEQLLYTLEPALDVYIGDLEKCVVMSIDKLLILLPIVHTFDVIGRKTKLLKDVFGLIYFDRIRYAVKRIYSNKIEIANKRADLLDKYQELLDTRQLKNISGVHMILILVNIATSWVNGNWLATETNIKVRREPVNISNVQLIGLLVSSSAIEIELYVNDMEQLGGRSESYEYKERILTASLNIARRALTYLDDKITENYENTQGTTDQPELSCNSVGRFPVEYGNIISKLHTIFTILHSFLTKHWGVIGMTFDDISATIVRDMFMFACKWIVLAMDNGHKKYAEELIQLILVMCEKKYVLTMSIMLHAL